MRDRHSNRGVEYTNCAPTFPDSYEEISRERGQSVIKIDSRVMELIHESGAAFTLYEQYDTGYVGCLLTSEQETRYYEIDPSKVTDEEVGWPDSYYQLVEFAVLPLQNAGWQLTYYDEKHTKRQMYEFFNGEGISGFVETP